jgi:ferrous-iron efflux pump FieF
MSSSTRSSSVAATGVITGAAAVGLSLFLALTANSLALWADWSATLLDFLAVFIAWRGFKQIEKKSTEKFNYGYGKFESFSSLGMAVLMIVSFIAIMTVAILRFQHPVPIEGLGVIIGIGLHIIFGSINGGLLFKTSQLVKLNKSALLLAQKRIYLVKFSANMLMIASLGLSYFFSHYTWSSFADPIAATIIALMILDNATKIFRDSTKDLLDYALEEQYQLLIIRALADHFEQYDNIQDIRTRISGGKTYIELFLEFSGELKHKQVIATSDSIRNQIMNLIKCDEVLIVPVKAVSLDFE